MRAFLNSFYKKLPPKIDRLLQNQHFRNGLPFIIFMGMAGFILSNTQKCRFEIATKGGLTRDELKKLGFKISEKPKSPQEYYEEVKDLGKADWENKRIPRPWEE